MLEIDYTVSVYRDLHRGLLTLTGTYEASGANRLANYDKEQLDKLLGLTKSYLTGY